MSSHGPYRNARLVWLKEQDEFFGDMLVGTGHFKKVVTVLESTFNPGDGTHLLDFAGISQAEIETAKSVCEKLMENLGPTAAALRDEIKERQRMVCATPSNKN